MQVAVHFFSYFKDLAGCAQATESLAEGSTVEVLQEQILRRFPKLAPMRRSTLIAVGVEYAGREAVLKEGDTVSFFPPVQGG